MKNKEVNSHTWWTVWACSQCFCVSYTSWSKLIRSLSSLLEGKKRKEI